MFLSPRNKKVTAVTATKIIEFAAVPQKVIDVGVASIHVHVKRRHLY